MFRKGWLLAALAVSGVLAIVPSVSPAGPAGHGADQVAGKSGMIATAHPLATQAGLEILKKGGNAVDAAVAAAFALGVVEPHASGIGGGGFMLIYQVSGPAAGGAVVAVDYREVAPRKTVPGEMSAGRVRTGPKSVAVPGALAGLAAALAAYGTISMKAVLEPAIRLAEDGFPANRLLVRMIRNNSEKLSKNPEAKRIYLDPRYEEGDTVVYKDLARTYRLIAEKGVDVFYRGEIAEAIAAEMARSKGWLDREDLENYRAEIREPVRGSYRGYDIFSMPPPSSGGVHIVEILNIMEGYDPARLGHNSAQAIQLMAEAMRRVFRDRARFMGDPDFVDIPLQGLLSKEYAAKLREGIEPGGINRKIRMPDPGEDESAQTTHISVADSRGNMVALTQTLNSFFASGIVVPGTGILLNNEMNDFAHRGPNAAAPGKKPVSSMSPTIVLRNGEPFLSVGMAGATRIISGLPQIIMNILDFGMNLQEAIAAPRFYCASGEISLESRIAESTRRKLTGMGYGIKTREAFDIYFGGAQGVLIDRKSGTMYGGADPRRASSAEGY